MSSAISIAGLPSSRMAALPFAASLVILAARALPVTFTFHPNGLGIVSLASQQHYPVQQEAFWLVFAVSGGSLAALLLARTFGRARLAPREGLALEALGVASLVSLLGLGGAAAPVAVFATLGAALALVASRLPGERDWGPAKIDALQGEPLPGPRRIGLWLVVGVLLGAVFAPRLFASLWNVYQGVPDGLLVGEGWVFEAEWGQHLAWTDAIRNGGLPGREFYCLYGPLYDIGLAAAWHILGRSLAVWELYYCLLFVAGMGVTVAFVASQLRQPVLALALPLALPFIQIRYALPLLGLLFLLRGMQRHAVVWSALAGVVAGLALLFSQEFALVLVACAAAFFTVRGDGRGALAFGSATAVTLGPLLIAFAHAGALGALLRDLAEYPRFVVAGFAKLPYPSLLSGLPLRWSTFDLPPTRALRLGYLAPASCVGALLLWLPLEHLDLRRPRASLTALRRLLQRDPNRLGGVLMAAFGLLAFRYALGRSAYDNILLASAVPAGLFLVALDRGLGMLRSRNGDAGLAAWRIGCVAALFVLAAFPMAWSQQALRATGTTLASIARNASTPIGSSRPIALVAWLRERLGPDDGVLFLPDLASFYYLIDRPSPTRFVLAHQMVTDAHRAEALSALRQRPPRFIVWDAMAPPLDGIPPSVWIGEDLLKWIGQHYEVSETLRGYRIFSRRPADAEQTE